MVFRNIFMFLSVLRRGPLTYSSMGPRISGSAPVYNDNRIQIIFLFSIKQDWYLNTAGQMLDTFFLNYKVVKYSQLGIKKASPVNQKQPFSSLNDIPVTRRSLYDKPFTQ